MNLIRTPPLWFLMWSICVFCSLTCSVPPPPKTVSVDQLCCSLVCLVRPQSAEVSCFPSCVSPHSWVFCTWCTLSGILICIFYLCFYIWTKNKPSSFESPLGRHRLIMSNGSVMPDYRNDFTVDVWEWKGTAMPSRLFISKLYSERHADDAVLAIDRSSSAQGLLVSRELATYQVRIRKTRLAWRPFVCPYLRSVGEMWREGSAVLGTTFLTLED